MIDFGKLYGKFTADFDKAGCAEGLSIKNLVMLRCVVHHGDFLKTSNKKLKDHQFQLASLWLEVCFSDEKPWPQRWERLEKLLQKSREELGWEFLEALQERHCDVFKKHIEQKRGMWQYYERAITAWYLRRYNLPMARKLLMNRQHAHRWYAISPCLLDFLLLGAVLPLWLAVLQVQLLWNWSLFAAPFLPAIVLGVACVCCLSRSQLFFQTLVPRLFFTVVIGYLFILAGGTEALSAVISTHGTEGAVLCAVIIMITASTYLLLEMGQRMIPCPPFPVRLGRTGRLVALAWTYSMLAGAVLFFATGAKWGGSTVMDWRFTLLATSVAFGVGLPLQVAWQEKALTAPL